MEIKTEIKVVRTGVIIMNRNQNIYVKIFNISSPSELNFSVCISSLLYILKQVLGKCLRINESLPLSYLQTTLDFSK